MDLGFFSFFRFLLILYFFCFNQIFHFLLPSSYILQFITMVNNPKAKGLRVFLGFWFWFFFCAFSLGKKLRKCRNFRLRLATKARVCKVASQKGSLGVMSHAPGSVGKCEGMNPHTSKGASTLGIGVPVDSQIFREQLQGSKPNGLRSSL